MSIFVLLLPSVDQKHCTRKNWKGGVNFRSTTMIIFLLVTSSPYLQPSCIFRNPQLDRSHLNHLTWMTYRNQLSISGGNPHQLKRLCTAESNTPFVELAETFSLFLYVHSKHKKGQGSVGRSEMQSTFSGAQEVGMMHLLGSYSSLLLDGLKMDLPLRQCESWKERNIYKNDAPGKLRLEHPIWLLYIW